MITGCPGSGKSSLALSLIQNKNARLISDDVTIAAREETVLMLFAPENISGMIEARHIGILKNVPQMPRAVAGVMIKLVEQEPERLPFVQLREKIEGIELPVFELWRENRYLETQVDLICDLILRKIDCVSEERKEIL